MELTAPKFVPVIAMDEPPGDWAAPGFKPENVGLGEK
jgi:hypothetical protein